MINVNQITSELAKMPDQALQQYAAMHKNDPYTVTLALSEANRRKQMRMGAQGAGAMQQPKVVDQDIAQMSPPPQQMAMAHGLPEEQGIGQLPAPNMQGMAGGGIVAFDDGGSVPGYAGGGQPDPKQAFATKYRDAAFAAGQALGVDPGIILSQWGVETRWGQSKNPVQANNLGNIKAGSTWQGPTITQHDKAEKSTDKYRSYDSTDAFVKDYVNLIRTNYPEAVGAGTDASKFAKGLHAGEQGGYATDKNYASTLISTAKGLPPLVPIASAQAGQVSAPAKTNPLSGLLPKNEEPYHPLEELQKNVTGAFNVAKQIPSNLYNLATSPEEYFRNINTSNLGPAIIGGFNPSHIGKAGVPNVKAAEAPVAPVVEPAIPTVTESVVSPAVEAARAKQAAARAAVQTQVGQPKPALQTPVEAAQAKQAAARAALSKDGPEIGNRFFKPEAPTFPITPESLAAREAAAAKLKAAQPKPAPAEGQTFPIEPESEGLAAIQRGKLELERQAEAARKTAAPAETTPITPVEAPAVGEKPISPFDVANATKSRIPSTLPYAEDQNPYVANTTANKYDTGVMGGERLPSAEENILSALKEKPEEAKTAEAPAEGGINWGDLALKMGLNLLAGKSQYAAQNFGEAGIATLGMQQAEAKAKSEAESRMAEALKNKSLGKYYDAYAAATERGAKEKNLELEAEKLIAQEISKDKFLGMPGNEAMRARRETELRNNIYRQLGLNPIMASSAPTGGAKFLGFEKT